MLLGVLLALAAGTIVIYIVSQATGAGPQMSTVVVAAQNLPANTTLVSQPQQAPGYIQISVAFKTVQIPTDAVPQDAFVWNGETDLESKLNNYVVTGQFLAGDILRTKDTRLVQAGTGSSGSLTNINPSQIPAGDVLMVLPLQDNSGGTNGKPIAVAGDHVDVLVTACNLPNAQHSGCESQTTIQNLYVYYVTGNSIVLAVDHKTALQLMELRQIASSVGLVVRVPGDSGHVSTAAVDAGAITAAFGF